MTAVLEARDVSFAYAARRVLHHVSFTVGGGELVALLGPNGAGKSTLLKLLAGVLRPRSGLVRAPEPRARNVAYLAQSEPLPPEFTAFDVVNLGRVPYQGLFGRDAPEDRDAVLDAMRRTGTLEFADRAVATLSGGERQRVALARALAQAPRALLLDEPTNHLDVAHQAELVALLRAEVRAGLAVVMVVHDLNVAARADRCVLVAGGRVVANGAPADVLDPRVLEPVYGVRLERLRASDGRVVVVPRA